MGEFGGSRYGEKRQGATCRDGWRRREPSAGVRRVAAVPARRADESGRFRSGASVSSKVRRYRQLYAALVALCVLFSGVTAYAVAPNDQGVLWGPTALSSSSSGVVVSANNNFDAALWTIGKWSTKIQLDNNMFAKLSNEGSGGRFYALAQLFHSYAETGSLGWPNDAQIEGYAAVLGMDAVWCAVVPDGLIAGAREDYLTVLGGGSLGGGSGADEYYMFECRTRYVTSNSARMLRWQDSAGNRYTNRIGLSGATLLPEVFVVRVPKGCFVSQEGALPVYIDLVGSSSTSWKTGVNPVVTYNSDLSLASPVFNMDSYTYTDPSGSSVTGTVYGTCTIAGGDGQNKSFGHDMVIQSVDDGVVTLSSTYTTTFNCDPYGSYPHSYSLGSSSIRCKYVGVVNGSPVGPNNWPDDPTTDPDPPEVPDPDPPENPDPDPWPDPPSDPVFDPDPPSDPPAEPWTGVLEPTNYTDYTPWLRAILQALNGIGTALGNHCVHLQEAIAEGFYEFSVTLEGMLNAQRRSLQSYLKSVLTAAVVDLCNQIDDSIYDLEQYMKSLAEWLAAQFDFSVSGGAWDDSTVVSWLKKIYWELQGRTKKNPTDTEVDNDLEWWQRLLQIITEKLGALVTDFVGDVGDFLDAVKNRFPFSVPWDVAAYLALLGAAPQTPHFTFVIPAIAGWWPEWEIEIDLSVFDSVAAVCRHMMLILWAFCLIMKTDWLGGVFDGAAHAVTGFFDRAVSRVAGG